MVDANGTRHHLLLTPEDWSASQPASEAAWVYNPERQAVTLRPQPFVFPSHPSDPALSVEDRRGATRDIYGHWYWIDEARTSLRARWIGARNAEHYWSSTDEPPEPTDSLFQPKLEPEPAVAEELAGLAATKGHYLVAGSPATGSLLVFDLHTGGAPPARIELPEAPGGGPTIPFDLAPTDDGGVVVLDRVNRALWVLDAALRHKPLPAPPASPPQVFQPKDGPERAQPAAPTLEPVSLDDCTDPVSVEPLGDGSFLVLDLTPGASTVRRYLQGRMGAVGSVTLLEEHLREPHSTPLALEPLLAHDMAVLGRAEGAALLFVANTGGNQAFAFSLSPDEGLTLRVQTRFFPLRAYTGKALVAPPGEAYAYHDQGELWLPLVSLPRQRFDTQAELVLPTLDGRDPRCQWHRLCLDACIPPEASVHVHTRAADDLESLEHQPWQAEPKPYLRGGGAELPYYSLWSPDELDQTDTGTWELLFQSARGRFLQIRLELEGNGRTTPAIRALRAHFPRYSYLAQYLPAVYQQDPISSSFIERFLANPEGMLTRLEGLIADAQVYFDVRTTEAVDWLGSWLGLAFDPAWSDYQRRLLIAHSAYFFLRRGTLPGVLQAIRLTLDPGPEIFQDNQDDTCTRVRIVERFRTRYTTSAVLGDPTTEDTPLTGDTLLDARARAHRFVVLLPSTLTASQLALVEQVVEIEKPAHTDFIIRQYWALFRVGEARLGLDTTLGEGGRFETLHLDRTALAEGYLGDDYPSNLTDRTVLAN